MPYYPPAGSGSGAPTNATYITQTANATLTNEQAVSSLTDGLLKHASGVLAQAVSNTDYAAASHNDRHRALGGDEIPIDTLGDPTDIATLNASTSAHGLLPKLSGLTTDFLRGDGVFAAASAGNFANTIHTLSFGTTGNATVNGDASVVVNRKLQIGSATKAIIQSGGRLRIL